MNHNGRIKKEEFVVLVDKKDRVIGIAPKATVHTKDTPLHRAFSLYIFNQQGEVLVQQRKKEKITWGGFWSNSCCGHPAPGESRKEAAKRRSFQELGIAVEDIEKMADYRHRFEHDNVVENEICPIFVGIARDSHITPSPGEIEKFQWVSWSGFLQDIKEKKAEYSPWSKEQVPILSASSQFQEWLKRNSLQLV